MDELILYRPCRICGEYTAHATDFILKYYGESVAIGHVCKMCGIVNQTIQISPLGQVFNRNNLIIRSTDSVDIEYEF